MVANDPGEKGIHISFNAISWIFMLWEEFKCDNQILTYIINNKCTNVTNGPVTDGEGKVMVH